MSTAEAFSVRNILRYWLTEALVEPRLSDGRPVPWKAADSMRALVANSLMALQDAAVRCEAVTGVEENLRGILKELDEAVR